MAGNGARLTIVQYAGDFREDVQRLAGGGAENYRAQRYTNDYIQSLAGRLDSVSIIVGVTREPYDTVLPSGVRAIGAGFKSAFDGRAVRSLVESTRPDLLVLRVPSRPLMLWAMRHRVRTLMLLADSFNPTSFKSRVQHRLLGLMLKAPMFDVVANHGRRAARQLVDLGVDPAKVVAWDYPAFNSPDQRPAKSAAGSPGHLLYVGLLIAPKGVDDVIEAVRLLHAQGRPVTLDLIGRGDADRIARLIRDAGLQDHVRLVGLVPNSEIIDRMAQADLVLVASRHTYAEGMPLTIYETYCSRTPLVASDHPMFRENVVDGVSGLVFPAGDSAALAERIARALSDPRLYAALSQNGAAAWEQLQIPAKWHELIDRWIDDDEQSRAWLRDHSLAAQ